MARIFISYKRANKEQVFPLVRQIEEQLGVKCWVDLDGIESSAQFASVICNAIDAADVVLFMYSSVHLDIDFENDWTIKEHNYARAKKKRIVLVKLDDAHLDNIFLMEYGSKNNIDSRVDEQMQKLLKDLRAWLKLPKSQTKDSISNSSVQHQNENPDEMVINVKGVSFKMKKVEGGTFLMGAQSEDKNQPNYDPDAFEDESPVHRVTLSDYYIGETLVTQELWKAVMDSNPSEFKSIFNKKRLKHPVENVSWNDCQEFIKKLNAIIGKTFRLPTEAEWEYAARGGNKSKGYKYSGSNNIDDVAWCEGNSSGKTHEVGTKAPNELGLYDMSGNVWEWCSDWYGEYSASPQTNPKGPTSGSYRVLHGGSWHFIAEGCLTRLGGIPDNRDSSVGLRLVCSCL